MSTEANKAMVLQWMDEFNARKENVVVEDFCTTNITYHNAMPPPETITGPEDLKRLHLLPFCRMLPDFVCTIDDQFAEGDLVASRWTCRAVHSGSFEGIAPTGKEVTFSGITIWRFDNGKIAEIWENMDTYTFLKNIGALPE